MKKQFRDIVRLWRMVSPFHVYFYVQLGLIFLDQLFIVGFAALNGRLLSTLVSKDIKVFTWLSVIWFVFTLLEIALSHATRTNWEKHLDQSLSQYLQEFSLKKILKLTVADHIEDHSALKLTIISKGESATKDVIDRIITTVIPTVTLVVLTVGTLFFYSTTIAILSLIAIGAIFIQTYHSTKKRAPLIIKNRDNWNEQSKIRTEAFTHLQLVKLLNREEWFLKKYISDRLKIVEHHLKVRLLNVRAQTTRITITETANIITLVVAGFFFLKGEYAIGTVYMIWSLSGRIYWQISSLSSALRDIPILYADAEKYFNVIDKEPAFDEKGVATIDLGKDITFSSVSFRYPKGGQEVFSSLSFTIPKGKITAFVGASGSGKSTITKLLLRAYTYTQGSITIGTRELNTIDAGYLREHIGYVEQHVDLFDDTIKENILVSVPRYIKKHAESTIDEVVRKARIDQFYHRLGEKGLNTFVGERGIKLSGGERQRVGIARAIIKDPAILIFDEATSSLDSENEKYVMDAIHDVSHGKTTIIIAHRLSTVRDADLIIVMDKGHIVGQGTHDDLMTNNETYQTLINHQIVR